jgi:hypothetical protein
VTLFTGLRSLYEASAVEPAKLLSRAQYETMLAVRYLVHGGRRRVSLTTPSSSRQREIRARYFRAASIRRAVYKRKGLLDGAWEIYRIERAHRRGIEREIQKLVNTLEKNFPRQHARFGALRCFRQKPIYFDEREWYSFGFLYTGTRKVNTVRALAKRLGYVREYEFLYDAFSALTHPRGTDHDLQIADGRVEIFSPHMAEAFPILCTWTCGWQQISLTLLTKTYLPAALPDVQKVGKRTEAATILETDLPLGW